MFKKFYLTLTTKNGFVPYFLYILTILSFLTLTAMEAFAKNFTKIGLLIYPVKCQFIIKNENEYENIYLIFNEIFK